MLSGARISIGRPGGRLEVHPSANLQPISTADIITNMAWTIMKVFLLFLLSVMGVASFTAGNQARINVKLPSATQMSPGPQVKPLVISLLATGEVYVADAKVANNQVESVVRAALANEPNQPVLLRADRDAKLQAVVTLFDSLLKAGANDLNLATLNELQKPEPVPASGGKPGG